MAKASHVAVLGPSAREEFGTTAPTSSRRSLAGHLHDHPIDSLTLAATAISYGYNWEVRRLRTSLYRGVRNEVPPEILTSGRQFFVVLSAASPRYAQNESEPSIHAGLIQIGMNPSSDSQVRRRWNALPGGSAKTGRAIQPPLASKSKA